MPNLVGLSNPCAGGLVSLFVDGLKGTAVILLWCCCMACDFCDASYIMIDIINMYIHMMILMYKIYHSIRTFCFYHSQALWNLSWWTSEVTYPRWRPGAVDRFDEGKMVVPLGWGPLSNQPHIQPYIMGIYWVYIPPFKGWNCHGIASF